MQFNTLHTRYHTMHNTGRYDCTFMFKGKKIEYSEPSKTMQQLGIVDGSTIEVDVAPIQEEDIGFFEFPHSTHLGNTLLCSSSSPTAHKTLTSRIEELITSVPLRDCVVGIPGDPSLPALIPNCLTPVECQTLIHYIQEHDHDSSLFDLQLHLTLSDLTQLLPKEKVEFLQREVFGHSRVDSIRLRRICATSDMEKKQGKCINFHRDYAIKTLQIALNDNSRYSGGRLVFALPSSSTTHPASLYSPVRGVGCGTLHDHTVVHGVTPFTTGVRYSLFFLTYAQ